MSSSAFGSLALARTRFRANTAFRKSSIVFHSPLYNTTQHNKQQRHHKNKINYIFFLCTISSSLIKVDFIFQILIAIIHLFTRSICRFACNQFSRKSESCDDFVPLSLSNRMRFFPSVGYIIIASSLDKSKGESRPDSATRDSRQRRVKWNSRSKANLMRTRICLWVKFD